VPFPMALHAVGEWCCVVLCCVSLCCVCCFVSSALCLCCVVYLIPTAGPLQFSESVVQCLCVVMSLDPNFFTSNVFDFFPQCCCRQPLHVRRGAELHPSHGILVEGGRPPLRRRALLTGHALQVRLCTIQFPFDAVMYARMFLVYLRLVAVYRIPYFRESVAIRLAHCSFLSFTNTQRGPRLPQGHSTERRAPVRGCVLGPRPRDELPRPRIVRRRLLAVAVRPRAGGDPEERSDAGAAQRSEEQW